MSLNQDNTPREQPAVPEPARLGIRPERPLPFPEGSPRMALIAAAIVSFIALSMSSGPIAIFFSDYLGDGGGLGPLALPTLSDSVLVEALIATVLLTIISLTIILAERHFVFPEWLPYVASFPVAWCLTLPSALELGGSLQAWLVFGAMAAGAFCVHWRVVTWGRTIWN